MMRDVTRLMLFVLAFWSNDVESAPSSQLQNTGLIDDSIARVPVGSMVTDVILRLQHSDMRQRDGSIVALLQRLLEQHQIQADVIETLTRLQSNVSTEVEQLVRRNADVSGELFRHWHSAFNPCASLQCQHGGQCVIGVNGTVCICTPGYNGLNCQNNINECASSPCQNGGTCVDGINRYQCNCLAGYNGDNCQNNINECASSPCQHGGECFDGINKVYCNCSAGFNGVYCQNDVNECASSPCQNGGTCVDGINRYSCNCSPRYSGVNCQSIAPRDCADVKARGETTSGVYTVSVGATESSLHAVSVYCDMTTDGGGWTVFQRRRDGSTDFYRNWTDYTNGFGNISHEFWLGNDNLYALTRTKQYKLRVDMGDFNGNTRYALYSNFKVGPSTDKYRLVSLGTYSGNAGDSLTYHVNMQFSTRDQDNDAHSSWNCAVREGKGAWWYNACSNSNLNGFYYGGPMSTSLDGVYWYHWTGGQYSLRFTEMKIKPYNV